MDRYGQYERLAIERRGRVLHVTMNRPGKLNAVDAVMHRELSTIFTDVNVDPDVDFVVLGGAGRAFSAGGDADWMNELVDVEGEWQRKAVESRRIWLSLMDLEKILVCKLNGPARGMCTTIMSLCDVVIAADSADIADTHLYMGLAAADGCNAIWPFHMGFMRTKDLLFNATSLSAQEAKELGLVTRVVPAGELDHAVDDYIEALQRKPVRALQLTKIATNFQMKQLVWPALESGLNLLELSNFSKEHKEAVQAFNERKKPALTAQAKGTGPG